jgi:phosphoesterase RecJ-like protein
LSPTEDDWTAAVALLGASQRVVLLCHVTPDGDALGALLALGHGLRTRGVDVVASWGTEPDQPFGLPDTYGFLDAGDLLVPPSEVPAAPEVLVTLDCGSVDRLGDLADRVDAAAAVVCVDHHPTNPRFGTVNLCDDDAAATVVLVAELLDRLGVPLTLELAAPLYTGLVTDTGSFRYRATTPEVHALAGRLLSTGLRHDRITEQLWSTASAAYVRLLGEVCAQVRLEPAAAGGLGLVWTSVGTDDLERAGLAVSDVEGVIDVIRLAREAEVAVVLKQDGPVWKVSTRSRGAVDVGAVCASLGGGGHRFAAGFTATDDAPQVLHRLREALDAAPHLPDARSMREVPRDEGAGVPPACEAIGVVTA